MELEHIKPNFTKIITDTGILYFSYKTLVAFERFDINVIYVTNKKYSQTTSKHINLIISSAKRESVTPEALELLANKG